MSRQRQMIFLNAIREENLKNIRQMLDEGVDPNFTIDENYETPLQCAINKGNCEIVILLLNYCATVDLKDCDSMFKLILFHKAVIKGNLKVVQLLLENGIDVYAKTGKYNHVALHVVAMLKRREIMSLIKQYGANIRAEDSEKRTPPLPNSKNCSNGKLPLETPILRLKESIGSIVKDDKELSYLKIESDNDSARLAKLLLGSKGNKILNQSVNRNKFKSTESLIKCGVNVNEEYLSVRPIEIALVNQNEKMLKLLLRNKAEVNYQVKPANNVRMREFGCTPLQIATAQSNKNIFNLLIKYGADINALDKHRNNVMCYAIQNWDSRILKSLVEHGFDIDMENNNCTETDCCPKCCTVLKPHAMCFAASRYLKDHLTFLLNEGAVFKFPRDSDYLITNVLQRSNTKASDINDIIQRHLIKMKYLNVSIPEEIFSEFQTEHSRKIEKKCELEFSNMKKEIVSSYYNLSLFNFVLKNSYNKYLLRNETLRRTLNVRVDKYRKKYPNYYSLLNHKIEKFTEEARLLNTCQGVLSNIFTNHFNLPDMIISTISQFLDKQDWKQLVLNK